MVARVGAATPAPQGRIGARKVLTSHIARRGDTAPAGMGHGP